MRLMQMRLLSALVVAASATAVAQQPIGTVELMNASVSGALQVTNGRAVMVGSATVTAKDHMANIALDRGGLVHVCATTGLHLSAGTSAAGASATAPVPLMLALDRGAMEVQMAATRRDMVMTPDLRFTLESDGPLDLQLRVTRNGDTCVEDRGAQAPVLHIADQFGAASYDLRPGQHVLFEHGDLREVVDHESSACGCPPEPPEPTMSVADALIHPGAPTQDDAASKAKIAAEEHPFPAAASAGLAPTASIPQASSGEVHTQVTATLSSSGGPDSTSPPVTDSEAKAATGSDTAAQAGPAPASTQPAPVQPESKGLFHAVGRFFRHIFGGG